MDVRNRLSEVRRKRGRSAVGLAKIVGVSRQTIYAMEAGNYIPNTTVALRLAQALEVSVEDLFLLQADAPALLRTEEVTMLSSPEATQPGQPVQLCQVDRRLIGSPPASLPWRFPLADGVVADSGSGKASRKQKTTRVQLFHDDDEFGNRVLVAGCDPGISILSRHVQRSGVELVVAHRNSSEALELLKNGSVHVAGSHIRDEETGESNLPLIRRMFSKNAVAVISLALWEEGIVVARGNPKSIRGIEDLARKDIRIVNREEGAGSRILLDAQLNYLHIEGHRVDGYGQLAQGHLPASWQVHSGQVDCCIATRAAARLFGLDFIPLVSERYDFVIRRQHLTLPGIQVLLDTLNRAALRRELEGVGGYDTSDAGRRWI